MLAGADPTGQKITASKKLPQVMLAFLVQQMLGFLDRKSLSGFAASQLPGPGFDPKLSSFEWVSGHTGWSVG